MNRNIAVFVAILFLVPFVSLASETCYAPILTDPNYSGDLAAYNSCVSSQNSQNCGAQSTASTTYSWDGRCETSCASGYYMDVKKECYSLSAWNTPSTTPAVIVPVVATSAPAVIVKTVYVPVVTPAPAPKVITIIKTVPATSTPPTVVAPVVNVPVPPTAPAPHPSVFEAVLNSIASWFSWL